MQGAIEHIEADGTIVGWARGAGPAPALARVEAGGELLAEAPARLYRPDLLGRGIGHGHYGFRARLRRRPAPGRLAARLAVGGWSAPFALDVPRLPPPARLRVEALLRREPGWTAADLLGAPACLPLEARLADWGARRFVDRLFRLALARWPASHERAFYAGLLDRGELAPASLLSELLASRERGDLPPDLPSPWSADFPL